MKWCAVCPNPVLDTDPSVMVAGQLIHRYCSIEGGAVCENDFCQYWREDHSGPCVT